MSDATPTRLERLLAFEKQNPDDPFTLYALGLEYLQEDFREAEAYFDRLLKDHEEYLATYYQAGKLFEKINKLERAKEIYRKGIELAKIQKEGNTLKEIQGALNLLLMEEDDDW